jgi:carboxymethylenebutenolidase
MPIVVTWRQEILGVHDHIKDICRRFANWVTWQSHRNSMPAKAMSQRSPVSMKFCQVASTVPDAQVLADLDAVVVWADFCWGW